MKVKLKIKLMMAITATSLFLSSCKDEVTPTPTPAPEPICLLTSTVTDGYKTSYTYNDGKLVKMIVEGEDETITTSFTYNSNQISEIKSGDLTYKIIYAGTQISKVEEFENGVLIGHSIWSFNADGKLQKMEGFYKVDSKDVLYQSNVYTFNGDNCSTITSSFDFDDDGSMETEMKYTFKIYDDKKNPYFGLPLYIMDPSNPPYLGKNNMLNGEMEIMDQKFTISSTYTYGEKNLPSKVISDIGGFGSEEVDFTYECK